MAIPCKPILCPALGLLLAGLLGSAGCSTPPARLDSAPSPVVETPILRPEKPQVDYLAADGASALGLILHLAGQTTEVAALTVALRDLERSGQPAAEALAITARRQGLWPHALYGTLGLLLERLRAGVPVMVQLQETSDAETRYFAVVLRYQPDTRLLQVQTGDGTRYRLSEDDFWVRWNPARFWMMTVCPPEAGTWELSGLEHISRMQFYDSIGQHGRADGDAAQALLLADGQPDRLVSLGVRERARGRLPAAEDLLRRALARDETYVRALNNLAYLLAEQGKNLEEAERLARTAVLREPTNSRVLDTLGFVLQTQGRWADALPVYERAYARARHMPSVVRRDIGLHLVQTYVHLERPEDARRVLGELRRQEPGLLLPAELAELIR